MSIDRASELNAQSARDSLQHYYYDGDNSCAFITQLTPIAASSSDVDAETTFLVGATSRQRRYGAVSTLDAPLERIYAHTLKHKLEPGDTLNSLALKYEANIMEIKRINKLFSNESMYLKDELIIPIDDLANSPDIVKEILSNQGSVGHMPSTSKRASKKNSEDMRPFDQRSATSSASTSSVKDARLADESFKDFLSRIDSNIKTTSINIKEIGRQSTVDTSTASSSRSSSMLNQHQSMNGLKSGQSIDYNFYQNS